VIGRRLSPAIGVLAAALPALVVGTMGYLRRWVSEDAFIDLRVARHLLAGLGPVFNPAERVEAYTNPLWVGLLALWGALGGSLEVGAAGLSLVLSVLGLLAAQAGAWTLASRLARGEDGADDGGASGRLALPLGMVVFAAVPVVWDFVTSGLEIGLAMAWLGGVYWLLARPMTARGARAAALVIGLGPLIRPDLAVFSAAFFLALGVAAEGAPAGRGARPGWVALALIALALPAAYQIFRMGYFAALVPNTAIAKEANAAYWRQGWRYARDFVGAYSLWIPLLLLLPGWAALLRRARQERDRPAVALLLAPVLGALAHATYVIRVGGDFMHGRLLLPPFFGLLLPVATVVPSSRVNPRWRMAVAAGVAVWAMVCALWLRVPYGWGIGPWGITDERDFYTRHPGTETHPGSANPIRPEDYGWTPLVRSGLAMRDRGRVLVIDTRPAEELPLADSVPRSTRAVVALGNVGILGYVAGAGVHVVDRVGLADPIASRLRLAERGRPGHEKLLPEAWIAARFADRHAAALAYPEAVAAAEALGCRELAALLQAVEGPLTARRFVENLRLAWTLRGLRIPPDPATARAELCGESPR
jgi:arabinofuranosyltransferase